MVAFTVIPNPGRVIRIDSQNGAVLDSSIVILIDSPPQPRMAIDANGTVFVTNGGFANGRLYSFNPDLTLRWSSPVPSVNIGGPAIGQGGILVVCGVGTDARAYRGGAAITADNNIAKSIPETKLVLTPNPFHNKLNLKLSLQNYEFTNSQSCLEIYDITGRLIKKLSLPNNPSQSTCVTWDGLDNTENPVPSGVYIVKFSNKSYSISKKITKY